MSSGQVDEASEAISNAKPTISSVKSNAVVRKELPKTDTTDNHKQINEDVPLLHSGAILGDLPALVTPIKKSPEKSKTSNRNALRARKTEDKTSGTHNQLPTDVPPEFICELSHKLMSDPVKSLYGHTYESVVIRRWLQDQGRICPLTGCHYSSVD